MSIRNQLMHSKIFNSEENNFYTLHFFSKIRAYLVLMLYCFLSICLVIFIFRKRLFFYAVTAYIVKSSNALLITNDCLLIMNKQQQCLSFKALLILRSFYYLETNPGPKLPKRQLPNFVIGTQMVQLPVISQRSS